MRKLFPPRFGSKTNVVHPTILAEEKDGIKSPENSEIQKLYVWYLFVRDEILCQYNLQLCSFVCV